MLESFGGAGLAAVLPVDRPAAAADLVEAQLACGDVAAAERALSAGEAAAARSGTPGRRPDRRRPLRVLLAQARPDEAAAAAAEARGPPPAPRSRRARARSPRVARSPRPGGARRPRDALVDAEARLDRFGALRRRDEAVRELRRLGHRVMRAGPRPRPVR